MEAVLAVLSGSIVGFTLGLIGGGGSIMATPLLLYVVGLQPHVAIGTGASVQGGHRIDRVVAVEDVDVDLLQPGRDGRLRAAVAGTDHEAAAAVGRRGKGGAGSAGPSAGRTLAAPDSVRQRKQAE